MILGLFGMVLILLGYYLKTTNKIDELKWHALNGAGSTLLVGYAALSQVWPFFILNLIGALIALKGIYECYQKATKD